MTHTSPAFGGSGKHGHSTLAQYVLARLPTEFALNDSDLQWLDECDALLKGEPTNASITFATKHAVAANPTGHIDPFESLIDAGICDRKCEPIADCSR